MIFIYNWFDVYIAESKERKLIMNMNEILSADKIETDIQNTETFSWHNDSDTNNVSTQNAYNSNHEATPEQQAHTPSITNHNIEDVSATEMVEGIDCIISIPSISLEKIVYTGNGREEQLKEYNLITAAPDMKYSNGGNYIICGHASQLYGHSLNRLKEVKVGDSVQIKCKGASEKYMVSSVTYEVMDETYTYCEQTDEQILTIISCAKYVAPNKYIVIKCKKQ